ncbi:hypothetical protein GYMLUDRAFT_931392 [Collybiopsis luxurians FD-317 M1]|nr:hypothetical protein GYMLUDRAFT_931392 [Collybiopsis luxurians FD-317 M1]
MVRFCWRGSYDNKSLVFKEKKNHKDKDIQKSKLNIVDKTNFIDTLFLLFLFLGLNSFPYSHFLLVIVIVFIDFGWWTLNEESMGEMKGEDGRSWRTRWKQARYVKRL